MIIVLIVLSLSLGGVLAWGPPHRAPPGPRPSFPWPSYWPPGQSQSPSPVATVSESTCNATATASYSAFSFSTLTSKVYATPVISPLSWTAHAPAYSAASTLLPASLTYTTYSLDRQATTTDDGPYGQSAYAALWAGTTYTETLPYTTTVSPTPVASSELVLPPALYAACPNDTDSCLDCFKFPADFIYGVAGSAWQIEGGLQTEGRGPSTLDSIGIDASAGTSNDSEVTDLNYYLYKQDIARLAAIGVPYYSFSISWTRIVPFGVADSPINEQGLAHYDDLINTLIEYGITPIVTLLHADNPVAVPSSNDNFRESFNYYSKIVMARYADRVPIWVTVNEPYYNYGSSPEGMVNIMLAHADVYKWYKQVLNGTGRITLKMANSLAIPSTSPNDIAAAIRYEDFLIGIFSNPLFLGQQIPASVLNTTGYNITALTPDQLTYINGSIDFYSVDPYTAMFAHFPPNGLDACAANTSDPNWPVCVITPNVQADGWLEGQESNDYAYIDPQYVRQQVGYIWNTYRPTGILVSEFGFNPFADALKKPVQQRYDLERTLYYQGFLRELLKAKWLDGVNVIGTLAWSFIDNNEFGSFANMYGMQAVNRTNGLLTRSYKRSFFDYIGFFEKFVQK